MKFINKKNKGFALKANIIVDAFIKGQRKKGKECKYFLFLNTPYKNKCKHSKKCTFYTLRFGCSFAAVNTIKPQLL